MKKMTLLPSLCYFFVAFGLTAHAQVQDGWVEWSSVDGLSSGDSFGSSTLAIGDVDGDLNADYLVAAPRSKSGFHLAGELSIHSGYDDHVIASINGDYAGQQIGYDVCFLGQHNGDGILKIAASAPFSDSSNGMFSGIVNVYALDLSTLTLSLWEEIPGVRPGHMFGVSIAATDLDSDGDLDLAIGALGDGALDGSVTFLHLDDIGTIDNALQSLGAPSSGEMYGWSLCTADANGNSTLLIGAPFANTDDSGAVVRLNASSGIFDTLRLPSPVAIAGANLGFAVAAGSDITGDGIADLVASAPNAGTGQVFVWHDELAASTSLDGSNSDEKFGYSLAITPDANFNGSDDLVVGAPDFNNEKGRFAVHDMSLPQQLVLHEVNGSAGQLLGNSVSTAGDLNKTSQSEILVGAIGTNNDSGRVYIYSPPEQDIGSIELDVSGTFNWETELDLSATNLSVGGSGTLYWYVGSQAGSSTSAEGYDLDIKGNVSLIGATPSPGSSAQLTYTIPDSIPDGQSLVFQVIEDRSGFIRSSTIDGGYVVDPGITLFVDGHQAGSQIQVRTKWGIPNSPVFIYGSTAQPSNNADQPAPDGSWLLNLRNATAIGSPNDKSDVDGNFTSSAINTPGSLSGLTVYFQGYDWDFFSPALTPITAVTFQ